MTVETSASVDEEDDVDGNLDFVAFCLAFRAFEAFQAVAAEGRKCVAEAVARTVAVRLDAEATILARIGLTWVFDHFTILARKTRFTNALVDHT